MQSKSPEKYTIHNQDELKAHLSLDFEVFIPRFEKEIELTQNELDKLKKKITENKENKERIEAIFKETILEYKKEKNDIVSKSVSERAWVQVEKLREEMPQTYQISQNEWDINYNGTSSKSKVKFKENPLEWAKENKASATLLWLWVWLIWFTWYKLLGSIFSLSEVKKDENKENAKEWFIDFALEKIGIKGELANWAKKFWIFGLVVWALWWAYFWMDKVSELFDKAKNFFWFENKEEKEANEKFAKEVSDSEYNSKKTTINPDTLKQLKDKKAKDILNWTWVIWTLLNNWLSKWADSIWLNKTLLNVLNFSSEINLEEVLAIKEYLKTKVDKKEIEIWDNTTIWDIIKMHSWNDKLQKQVKDPDLKVVWAWIATWIVAWESNPTPEANEWQDWLWITPDNASVEEAKKWPWIGFLLWNEATGEDRTLASRVLEFAWKSLYYERLYNTYLKFNSIDIWWKKLDKMKAIYNHNNTHWYTWSLAKIIKVEEKWWIQRLLADLQETTDPNKIKSIKKNIDSHLREIEKFEKAFSKHVRESKLKWSILRDTMDEAQEFNRLKDDELRIWNEIHDLSKKFDDEIIELRKTETDPKALATKEAEIRKKYSEALNWPNWRMIELRNIQKEMISNLEVIANWDSARSKEFLEANKGRIKKSSLPWWKIWLALMWITAWSVALTWFQDKEKLAYMWAEVVWWFIPFLNVWLDFKQIATWKDFAWDTLAWWERWGLAPAFLVLDTVGSLAVATWIWSALWIPILAWSWALKGMRWVKWWAKIAKEVKDAEKVANWAHLAQWITEETKILQELKKSWINFLWNAGDLMKVPSDFLAKYREWMQAAYSSSLLKMASPLATTSKIAVYWWLWYSVYTGTWEIGKVVIDKAKSWIDFAKDIL